MSELTVGSVWRRWEPHVHVPGTLLNDQFGTTTVEQALDALAASTPKIEVVGVTDYYITAAFRATDAAWRAGAGKGIAYLFPNVELRLDIPTKSGSGINLHLICAPEDVDGLDVVLASLSFSFSDHDYACDRAGLIALGRAYKGDKSLDEAAALREGANQFKVNFNQLREKFLKDAWFREHCLIAVAAGSSDGTSGLQSVDDAFTARRKSIERFSHIIFASSEGQRNFWLGRGVHSAEEIAKTYGGLKPCLHGSDAHQFDKLGNPDGDRYTWLKGDPHFETLRMACFAPETRALVAPVTPAAGTVRGRIRSVEINSTDWFTPGSVPINPGLVAIIGARGSGKTALADLIAVGAGASEPFENPASFVRRAGWLLQGNTATVEWGGGEQTAHDFEPPDTEGLRDRRVRYLSQQFVERLCASDGVSDELLTEIERVIFDSWPIEERQGATDFQELLVIRLAALRAAQSDELEAIRDVSECITTQRVIKNGHARKVEEKRSVGGIIKTLDGRIKELTAQSGGAHGARHGVVSAVLARKLEALQTADRQVTALKALQSAVNTAMSTQFPQFLRRLRENNPYAPLAETEWQLFLPRFSGEVDAKLRTTLKAAESKHAAIAGPEVDATTAAPLDNLTEADLEGKTVNGLRVEQGRLEKLVGLDKERAQQLTRLQSQLAESRARMAKVESDIAETEKADTRIANLVAERQTRYAAYFNALLGQEQELLNLYAPLDDLLRGFGPTVAKLNLKVRRRVNVAGWAERGEALLDLRTAGSFKGVGEVQKVAEPKLRAVWESGDGEQAAKAIQKFSADHSESLRTQSKVARGDEKAYREWERGVARWLYSVDHIEVTYDLEYDGLSVARLSPGTRGIVLLLLYLAVDQAETDPLIIDQPEENLDPESVFSELVTLFQAASARRQIIMVTHNANLVVNTDVDQVVVATCRGLEEGKLPQLQYVAGGLEDRRIRQAVCDVLEGGVEAFRQRARRLHIEIPAVTD